MPARCRRVGVGFHIEYAIPNGVHHRAAPGSAACPAAWRSGGCRGCRRASASTAGNTPSACRTPAAAASKPPASPDRGACRSRRRGRCLSCGGSPGAIVYVPLHGLRQAGVEILARTPAELARDFRGVDGVAPVVAGPVLDEADELGVLAAFARRRLVEQRA